MFTLWKHFHFNLLIRRCETLEMNHCDGERKRNASNGWHVLEIMKVFPKIHTISITMFTSKINTNFKK
jgi:hypothetical protein